MSINKAFSSETLAKLEMVKLLFPDWRQWLWRALEELETMHGEDPIYTWSWKVRFWGLPVPVSFTLRVKHLRWALVYLVGEKP